MLPTKSKWEINYSSLHWTLRGTKNPIWTGYIALDIIFKDVLTIDYEGERSLAFLCPHLHHCDIIGPTGVERYINKCQRTIPFQLQDIFMLRSNLGRRCITAHCPLSNSDLISHPVYLWFCLIRIGNVKGHIGASQGFDQRGADRLNKWLTSYKTGYRKQILHFFFFWGGDVLRSIH